MIYILRILWLGTLLWGILIPWLSARPPLIDLPQHAGQISLLADHFSNNPSWANLVNLNLFTPYLGTYLLIFVLSQVFTLLASLKIVLSLCFAGFIASCVLLRKEFDGNPQLDWLFFIGYFGYAWTFGFISFLFAAPIGLILIWVTCRLLNSGKFRWGIIFLLIGILLLLSHGLMFGFIFLICFGIYFQNIVFGGFSFNKSIPFIALFLFCISFLAITAYFQPKGLNDGLAFARIYWNYDFAARIKEFLIYPLDQSFRWGLPLVPVLLITPFLISSRLQSLRSPAVIPFFIFLVIFFLFPTYALKIQYLYQRFAIVLFPFFSFLFIARPIINSSARQLDLNTLIASTVLITCVWVQFWTVTTEIRAYAKESKDFENILDLLEPRSRALYLPINAESDAQNRDNIYLHYGQWYQAEKNGFVDFNFAWTPAMIMRFEGNNSSPIKPGFEWESSKFNWNNHEGATFRYFIFKSKKEIVPSIFFIGAPCTPHKIFNKGEWQVFEKSVCTKS